jgi:hypothetical protein
VSGDPLEQLRDWHLPDPIPWWPPAPGWWVLAVLLLVAAVWMLGRIRRRHRQGAAARSALTELSALRAAFSADDDARAFAAGVSRLLRRLALERFPREQVAGLTGPAWLDFLDATGGGDAFRHGPGRALAEIAHGADSPGERRLDPDALTERAAAWIRSNEKSGRMLRDKTDG